MRQTLKRAAEAFLTESGLPWLARRRHQGHCLVLAFHNIVASGRASGGDRPLHLPLESFEGFLDLLVGTHEVIGLDQLDAESGQRPRAAITFDDAYLGTIRYGLPALAARGLPATIFVAPGLLGRAACWWDQLADPAGGLSAEVRTHALTSLRGREESIMAWAGESGRKTTAPAEAWKIASEAELATSSTMPGITFGAHTWSHPNLATLAPLELAEELNAPLAWLRERFACARPWLAYPYGMDSDASAQVARDAGYTRAFRVEGGWIPQMNRADFHLPRWSVSAGLTPRGFVLRSAGVLGD